MIAHAAILEQLQPIFRDVFDDETIDKWIKTDFRRGKSDEVKNIELWEELIELTKKHKVTFVWVKGHADNEENERCDKLANEAMDEMIK